MTVWWCWVGMAGVSGTGAVSSDSPRRFHNFSTCWSIVVRIVDINLGSSLSDVPAHFSSHSHAFATTPFQMA